MTPAPSDSCTLCYRLLFVVILAASLAGCVEPAKKVSSKYADIAGFVKAQQARLTSAHALLVKTGGTNGKLETVKLDSVNWAHELDPFLQADINKPSWQGFFQVDSSKTGDTILYSYQATKDELTVRSLKVKYVAGQGIRSFNAKVDKRSVLSDVNLDLYMSVESDGSLSYKTNASQKVVLQDSGLVTVIGRARVK